MIKKIIPLKLRQFIRVLLHPRAYYWLQKEKVTYGQDLLYTHHSAGFLDDARFMEAYEIGKALDRGILLKGVYDIHWRMHTLCWAATLVQGLEGDFVDCGVCGGMYARTVMHYVDFQTLDKKYYLLDTFTGLDPKYSSDDEMIKNEKFGYRKVIGLYEHVQKAFRDFNVDIIQGSVPDTLPQVTTERICYLSIDMNSVYPEIAALEFFWDKIVPGGVIILDDYGFANNRDQKVAHDEWAATKQIKILSLPTAQGLIIKSR
ncbi:MAG: TylF/MycF/NovP-related O-methyltransferase [Ardenticatenaceae bacterium]